MPRLGSRTQALAVTAGLGMAWGEGCGDAAAPEAEPSSAASVEVATKPLEPEPSSPGAFELPGLRAWAPRPRFTWPVESVHLTSSFGWRVDPVSGRGTRLHRGIDLRGATGDLVLSIGAGTVAFVGHDPLLGNLVVIDHGEGLQSLYGHLSDVLVATDVPVDRGAAIGLVGNTGRSAATHLHLTVTLDGQAIDPLEILGEPLHRPAALVSSTEAAIAPTTAESSAEAGLGSPSTTPPLAPIAIPRPNPNEGPPAGGPPPLHPLPHRSDDGGEM